VNKGNLLGGRNRHQNGMMHDRRRTAVVMLVCGLACLAWTQDEGGTNQIRQSRHPSKIAKRSKASIPREPNSDRTLSEDDRLSVMAAALDSKVPRFRERDCSHLVHAIYQRAGFPYTYASSDDLYAGVAGFQREMQPEPGDLVVWHGHAGIVVRPSRHVFYSFLRRGPGIDDYTSRYWRGRGTPHFYRYLKNDRCAGCVMARGENQ